LLLFRLLYYLSPFVIALAILGVREIWLSLRRAKPRPAMKAPAATAPIRSEIEIDRTNTG
jgi:hypothetical protein